MTSSRDWDVDTCRPREHATSGPTDRLIETLVGATDVSLILNRIIDGDGNSIDAGEVERVLGVRTSGFHWAVTLWSESGQTVLIEDIIRFALMVVRSVGGDSPFIALADTSEVLMWIRWAEPPKPEMFAAVCERMRLPVGIGVCSGPVLAGLSGFRRSMIGARAARSTANIGDWLHNSKIPPVPLLVGDHESSRWFVEDALGDLGRRDPWCAKLRETLRLYLAYGRSRQQVAAELYINRNTVAYRVQKAEQLIGHPIDDDSFELRLALEIERFSTLDDGSSGVAWSGVGRIPEAVDGRRHTSRK